ncbi:MAG TPA: GGDEF domain-containing protein [Acidiferrobacterales bacterium]|nr:GGDEF domain-containing protein [Acidiferrobacterales bacterium]
MHNKDFAQPSVVRSRLQADRKGRGLDQALERMPPVVIALGSLLLTGLVALLDLWTGEELSLALFYLVPIGIAAWYGTSWMGLFVAIIAGIAWVAHDLIDLPHGNALILYWNSMVRVMLFLIVAYLLSSLRQQLLEVSIQASTDPLTGLFNRRYLYERIRGEMQRARRYNHPLTLICIDVDDFKDINDQHGHVFGDAVLRGVGEVLHGHVRESDVPSRTGGDELAVLLIETASDEGREAAEKLQRALRARMMELGPAITFSIGIVTFLESPRDIDQMFRLADEQLYQAKHQGKDQIAQTVVPAQATAPR